MLFNVIYTLCITASPLIFTCYDIVTTHLLSGMHTQIATTETVDAHYEWLKNDNTLLHIYLCIYIIYICVCIIHIYYIHIFYRITYIIYIYIFAYADTYIYIMYHTYTIMIHFGISNHQRWVSCGSGQASKDENREFPQKCHGASISVGVVLCQRGNRKLRMVGMVGLSSIFFDWWILSADWLMNFNLNFSWDFHSISTRIFLDQI